MNIVPDENAADLKISDFKFQDHGTWKPDDGMVYHYFSVLRHRYVLVSSIDNYGRGLTVFYDGGYSSLIINQEFSPTPQFKASPRPDAIYDRYGVLLIEGKRLA